MKSDIQIGRERAARHSGGKSERPGATVNARVTVASLYRIGSREPEVALSFSFYNPAKPAQCERNITVYLEPGYAKAFAATVQSAAQRILDVGV